MTPTEESLEIETSNSDDVYPDVCRTGPIEQLLGERGWYMNTAVRLNIGIALVKRLSLMIEEREVHIVFTRKLAAAVLA
jgi:hypothetical protein